MGGLIIKVGTEMNLGISFSDASCATVFDVSLSMLGFGFVEVMLTCMFGDACCAAAIGGGFTAKVGTDGLSICCVFAVA